MLRSLPYLKAGHLSLCRHIYALVMLLMSAVSVYAQSPMALPRYTVQISTPKASISGIMLAAQSDDCINASLVNEFGVSALALSYSKPTGKVRLTQVVKFLDKWYIRPILRRDMAEAIRLLYLRDNASGVPSSAASARYDTVIADSIISLHNKKRNITYTFTPLPINPVDPTDDQP